jgi:probable rRNA maturation factor
MRDCDEPELDIDLHITQTFNRLKVPLPRIKKLVKTICRRFSGNKRKAPGTKAAMFEISLAIIDDAHFRELNRRFLGHRSTSDCLSFDLSEDRPESHKLFEIVINGESVLKQASLRGHSNEAELALYVAHGLLHQFGFDDSTPGRARKMHEIEDEILQRLGYGIVYNKSIGTQAGNTKKKK